MLLGRILDLPPAAPRTRLCAQSIMGQIIHYAHHSPVISSRLLAGIEDDAPEQQDMVANHIADFSLSYLTSVGNARATVRPLNGSEQGLLKQ